MISNDSRYSRQGSASLQLDEQGNIVREKRSSPAPGAEFAAPKPVSVTTMPLDQNGNIRIVDKTRTESSTFEVRNLRFRKEAKNVRRDNYRISDSETKTSLFERTISTDYST